MAIVFIYGTLASVRFLYEADDLRELVSQHLALHVDYVRNDIGDPPRIDAAERVTQRVPIDIRLSGPDLEWASDPDFPRLDELVFGTSENFSDRPGAWVNELKDVVFARQDNHAFLKIDQGAYSIVVASPKISDTRVGLDLQLIIISLGLPLLLLFYLAVRWLFRPLKDIREGAARIGRGELGYRIAGTRNDELGELAGDVNAMAADVESMLEAKRQLLLGISHELRTPLSRMRIGLEFLADGKERKRLRDDIIEMEGIIGTLLHAEKLSMRHAALNLDSVHIPDMVSELIDQYFDRERSSIDVTHDDANLLATCDEVRLTLLLKNLVGNALRYGCRNGQPVMVRTCQDGGDLVITVADFGPGLTPSQRAHLGEPFFRSDESRDRDTGGTGLGLYLAKTIAEAHDGSLTIDDSYRDGARFIVRMPIL
ncbi:MAG: HAMP domain-containing sensor histidine kinase [Pseudomonadota bacterium]